ncbi:MAG: tRNA threonylcarbamoyladenosine dehydratase [Raoultibacter sp.]
MDNHDSLEKSELLVGQGGLTKLAGSSVMIFGLGGVGSSCVEALARSGVGTLTIIDAAPVRKSNLNRQAIAFMSTLGRRKTEVMGEMIADINPQATVVAHDVFVLPENLAKFFAKTPDYVVDALDTVATKLALAQFADARKIALVSSMGAGNKFHPEQLEFADIYDTAVCPLCKIVRKEARARGIERLRVLYSREKPADVPIREGSAREERANIGTMSYLPPIMGQMMASEVIRGLLGIGK